MDKQEIVTESNIEFKKSHELSENEVSELRDRYNIDDRDVYLANMVADMMVKKGKPDFTELAEMMSEKWGEEVKPYHVRYALFGSDEDQKKGVVRRTWKMVMDKYVKVKRVDGFDKTEWWCKGLDVMEGKEEWSNVRAFIWKTLGGALGVLKDGREVVLNQKFVVTQADGRV